MIRLALVTLAAVLLLTACQSLPCRQHPCSSAAAKADCPKGASNDAPCHSAERPCPKQ